MENLKEGRKGAETFPSNLLNLSYLHEGENIKCFLQKTYWFSRAQSETKFLVKEVDRETIIDMRWYKIWQNSGCNHTRFGADEEPESHSH